MRRTAFGTCSTPYRIRVDCQLDRDGYAITNRSPGVRDPRRPTRRALWLPSLSFAEFETDIRKERQMEGIAKAKAANVYKGRKPSVPVFEVAAWR